MTIPIDVDQFLAATVRTATPLALAALGETVVERAGVINIGLEGAMIAGAFAALVGANAAGVGGGFAGRRAAGGAHGARLRACSWCGSAATRSSRARP
jgi:simple sugar transport system permease protein